MIYEEQLPVLDDLNSIDFEKDEEEVRKVEVLLGSTEEEVSEPPKKSKSLTIIFIAIGVLIVLGLVAISVVLSKPKPAKEIKKPPPTPKDVKHFWHNDGRWVEEIIDEEGNVMPEGTRLDEEGNIIDP